MGKAIESKKLRTTGLNGLERLVHQLNTFCFILFRYLFFDLI